MRAKQSGFTLLEIMIVLVIISVIAGLVVPNLMSRPDEARITVAQTDMKSIAGALELYRLDNSRYPTTEQGLAALVEKPTSPPTPMRWNPEGYLKSLPKDPWGSPYQYALPGKNFEIFSLGADGKKGGEGFDKDIIFTP